MKRILIPAFVMAISVLGACKKLPCDGVVCSAGQTCDTVDGICKSPTIPDRCLNITCAACQSCDATDGVCKAITCAAGETCNTATNRCERPDLCRNVTCTNGQTCDAADGRCKDPPPPQLGAVVDRMGRPAVNTALTNPFDIVRINNVVENMGDTTKNNYNADGNPANWGTRWTPYIQFHLGIFDTIDGNCGNQTAAGAAVNAMRYSTLAGVLAGDALQVDISRTTCAVGTTTVTGTTGSGYLAVERNALGIANTDCGGRTLDTDTIDVTFGALTGLATANDGTIRTANASATYPFMAAPL